MYHPKTFLQKNLGMMREIKCQITNTSVYETVIKRMNTNNQKNLIKISYLVITVSFPIIKNLACLINGIETNQI